MFHLEGIFLSIIEDFVQFYLVSFYIVINVRSEFGLFPVKLGNIVFQIKELQCIFKKKLKLLLRKVYIKCI